jgi:hypothetical protein
MFCKGWCSVSLKYGSFVIFFKKNGAGDVLRSIAQPAMRREPSATGARAFQRRVATQRDLQQVLRQLFQDLGQATSGVSTWAFVVPLLLLL